MIRINLFNSVKEPTVKDTILLPTWLHRIQIGDPLIEEVRHALTKYPDKKRYNEMKATLPCVNYSFRFNGYRNSQSIIESTGLMAFDIDGDTTLPNSPFVYVSYCSPSNTGRLVLVRVNNLNLYNFRYNYQLVSEEIGVNPDWNAAKVTQPFVLSFDPSIYIEDNSKVWETKEPKKTHVITEKKERVIGNGVGPSKKRFSNLNEIISNIDFDGELVYDKKKLVGVASIFIPRNGIPEGYRNRILLGIGYQFRALNPDCTRYDVLNLLGDTNTKHCKPKISQKELRKIVESIMKTKREDLVLTLNETKRFFFNPDYDLTTKEKQSVVMTALNKDKGRKSVESIEAAIQDWDFVSQGKITQKNLAVVTGKNIKTIKKYYPIFKQEIKRLNKEFAENKRPPP